MTTRRLAAILAADVVNSRHDGDDAAKALAQRSITAIASSAGSALAGDETTPRETAPRSESTSQFRPV